jgi:hypothetical protein
MGMVYQSVSSKFREFHLRNISISILRAYTSRFRADFHVRNFKCNINLNEA